MNDAPQPALTDGSFCQIENAMNRSPYDSTTADAQLSIAESLRDSFPDARRVTPSRDEHASRWRHMIGTLRATKDMSGTVKSPVRRGECSSLRQALDCAQGLNVRIEIVERPSPVSAVLSWSDPTRCHYGHQPWQKTVAKRPGICAWSGGPVRCGDAIFRPATRGSKPSNGSAMILAIYIECPELATTSDATPNAGHQ